MANTLPEGIALTQKNGRTELTVDTRSWVRLIIMQLMPIVAVLGIAVFLYLKAASVAPLLMIAVFSIFLFLYAKERIAMNAAGKIAISFGQKDVNIHISGWWVNRSFSFLKEEVLRIGEEHYQSAPSGSFSKGNQEFGLRIDLQNQRSFQFGKGYLTNEQCNFVSDSLMSQGK